MTTRRALSITGNAAVELLHSTVGSASVFPPLKVAANGALAIADIVVKFQTSKEEWRDFKEYVQNTIAAVIESFIQLDETSYDLRMRLADLQRTLDDVLARIEFELALPRHTRALKLLTEPDMIADMRRKLANTINIFQFRTTVAAQIDSRKALEMAVANRSTLSLISQDNASTALNVVLNKLRYVRGASWDTYRTCLPNTRTSIIDQTLSWITSANNSDMSKQTNKSDSISIMLLTGVAGAGKSTIAHTIAQLCSQKGQLVSSFFFNRETEGRNTPNALFTTIAADLSRVNRRLAESITDAIEKDQGLPLAPISRQFEALILKPTRECPVHRPLVIVLDALDEGWDRNLLKVLRDDVPRLPQSFRIFVTSRTRPELDSLCRKPHVRLINLDLGAQENIEDIALFVPHRLHQLADERDLGDDWPGEALMRKFEARANGLFLWVDTVCNYLVDRDDPTRELEKLLSSTGAGTSSAEAQMDKLYATILESCNWDDESFVAGYRQVMGTTLASKTPLTVSAQRTLFHNKPVASDYTLQRLSPLLTGTSKALYHEQPVCLLHQSLRDFLVSRSDNSSGYARYRIVEHEWNEQLTLQCLDTLNRELNNKTAGAGFLAKDKKEAPGVPIANDGEISAALWYACQFWIDHFLSLKMPISATIENALKLFVDTKLIQWMEVMAARGVYRGLAEVRNPIWHFISRHPNSEAEQHMSKRANACVSLGVRLSYDDRLAESLIALQEAVELNLQLVENNPDTFAPDLAASLHSLAKSFNDLGHHDKARIVVQEAVRLMRQLAANDQAKYTLRLAKYLNSLSMTLRTLDRGQESLELIQEAVSLFPQLPVETLSKEDVTLFACSIHNLSVKLSDTGLHEEALAVGKMLIELFRSLAAEDLVAYTPNLAMSLHKQSINYYNLRRLEETLAPMNEAIDLRRQLALDGRTASLFSLVTSLRCITNFYSELGRHPEALATNQQGVELCRQLAKRRPAVYTSELRNALYYSWLCQNNAGLWKAGEEAREEAESLED
ncbi:hypothetical protein FRC12_005411 [Ceratobasidium sp. 428]|nr:hypothetical protein FRC12_005411 [Ceratobasidium sp. 428]